MLQRLVIVVTDMLLCMCVCFPNQVNLAVNLGKPIIPLLMEKMAWPPEGAMGPIFGEYLFIRFFKRPSENTEGEKFWTNAKFQELLMQLRYSTAPDEGIIEEGN